MGTKKTIPPSLTQQDIMSIIESTLLALARPVTSAELIKLFSVEKIPMTDIQQALTTMKKTYEKENRGIELVKAAGGWRLQTKEENKSYIKRLIKGRPFQLSPPAMEVLSIIAYHQPCTKAEIDHLRKMESGHLLRTLLEKELIDFGPKSQAPGRPLTYKTTKGFLSVFNLNSLKDLPDMDDIKELMKGTNLSSGTEESTPLLTEIPPHPNPQKENQTINQELENITQQINEVNPKMKWDKHKDIPNPT